QRAVERRDRAGYARGHAADHQQRRADDDDEAAEQRQRAEVPERDVAPRAAVQVAGEVGDRLQGEGDPQRHEEGPGLGEALEPEHERGERAEGRCHDVDAEPPGHDTRQEAAATTARRLRRRAGGTRVCPVGPLRLALTAGLEGVGRRGDGGGGSDTVWQRLPPSRVIVFLTRVSRVMSAPAAAHEAAACSRSTLSWAPAFTMALNRGLFARRSSYVPCA